MRFLIAVFLAVLLMLTCGKDKGTTDILVGRAWKLTSHASNYHVDSPNWSPDGTKMTYVARQHIYVTDVIEGLIQPFAAADWSGQFESPDWYPEAEANKLCFLQIDGGIYTIFVSPAVANTEVRDAVEVLKSQDQLIYPSFTADGSDIVYFRPWIESDSTNLVWKVPSGGSGEPTPIDNSEGWVRIYDLRAVQATDDIMYIDRRGQSPLYYYNIKLLPLAGGTPLTLTEYGVGSPFAIGGAAMSNDGGKIALTLYDSRSNNFVYTLWIMDTATKELTQVTSPSWGQVSSPAWSPDGKQIAVMRYGNIHIVNLEE